MSIKEAAYNIEDYLAWRADVPFSADPFNEVDNLILCELAYSDFRGILDTGASMSLIDLRERFFETHSREELRRINTFMSKAPLLMDAMADGGRFGNTKVTDFIDVVDTESELQIAAMTFLLDVGTAFVCFRGTDNTVVGWKEDFNFSYLSETTGQGVAVKYLNGIADRTDRPLRVGGHSKGGNFAVYAASFCDPAVQERITEVYTNDGPGFRKEVTLKQGYEHMKSKVISIIPDTSIIGQLLNHDFPDIFIKSSENGFKQHDGFTWCIERNRFIRAELSDLGEFIRETMTDWLSKMDDDLRASFVNIIFDLIESTDFDTFHDLKIRKLQSAEKILSSAFKLPREEQRKMVYAAETLLRSGGDKAKELLPEIINREMSDDNWDIADILNLSK